MSVNLNPGKDQVALANSKPLAYSLCVVVILLGIVTTMYFRSTSTNRYDCRDRVTYLEKENKELKLQVNSLFEMVLKSNTDFKELKKNTDSVLRAAIKETPIK